LRVIGDDDVLEPILPKSPPTADEVAAAAVAEDDTPDVVGDAGRLPWERWVLLGCAVAATLCLVLITIRLSSIADDQRVQTCQTRVFAAQQLGDVDGIGSRSLQREFARELARCVGMDVPDSSD
jgi:hypothetical protein